MKNLLLQMESKSMRDSCMRFCPGGEEKSTVRDNSDSVVNTNSRDNSEGVLHNGANVLKFDIVVFLFRKSKPRCRLIMLRRHTKSLKVADLQARNPSHFELVDLVLVLNLNCEKVTVLETKLIHYSCRRKIQIK